MLTKQEIKAKIRTLKIEVEEGIIKFVLEKTKLTIPRYLTRQLKLKEDGWSDHQIRDLSLELETEMKPPTIKYCETPQDYVEMYKCGNGSCMKVGTYTHLNNVTAEIYKEFKLWPSIWYHYNPYSQGVFTIDSNGRATARAFIIEDKTYGYPYSDNYTHAEILKNHLSAKGLVNKYSYAKIEKEFRVPGVEYQNISWGPLPHCDDFNKGFGVKYDSKTNEFVYGPGGMIVGDTYKFKGWLESTRVDAL